ncbi:hypothetical protein Bca4012_087316 [Brassica carinata]|uniref:Uncharacterized protein n=1 Tax=Brassica carinata TaxID=52824 RepID=A0A8X7PDS9_BRACI|nr:hypothetical protein Bca52824_088993 [Brassica carinata]
MAIPRPPRYRTDEVDITLKVCDLIDERIDANQILGMKLNLQHSDAVVWGFSRNGIYDSQSGYKLIWKKIQLEAEAWRAANVPDKEDIVVELGGASLAQYWQKPCPSFIKMQHWDVLD